MWQNCPIGEGQKFRFAVVLSHFVTQSSRMQETGRRLRDETANPEVDVFYNDRDDLSPYERGIDSAAVSASLHAQAHGLFFVGKRRNDPRP